MVRIMGNSTERVIIEDLNDVIYYKQIKEYTDQEFELSKALQREQKKTRIIVLEENKATRGSEDFAFYTTAKNSSSSSLSVSDLKSALREILPEMKNAPVDVQGAMREIAPMIVDMVRQEISKISVIGSSVTAPKPTEFQDPIYIPEVTSEGMTGNIEAKKTEISSAGTNDALEALRRLNKSK
jgi:hypothetical protein